MENISYKLNNKRLNARTKLIMFWARLLESVLNLTNG